MILVAPRLLKLLLDFRKIFASVVYMICVTEAQRWCLILYFKIFDSCLRFTRVILEIATEMKLHITLVTDTSLHTHA